MAHVIDRDKWAKAPDRWPDHWQGELQCGTYGSKICLIFNYLQEIGGGPRLHMHPYCEISSFALAPGCSPSATGRSRRRPARS